MTIMADGTDSTLDIDPDGMRPRMLHAITAMMILTARPDLPAASWLVGTRAGLKPGTTDRESYPILRGQLPHLEESAARAALQRWATAFDAEITERRHLSAGTVHAEIACYFLGVPVRMVAVIEPGEPGEPGEPERER